LGPLQRIAVFCNYHFDIITFTYGTYFETLISNIVYTGEVSVKPYPSITGISAAANIRANRGCKAALPETIKSRLPPKPSFHLLKISLRAILS
jgi:hypothetical protein